MRTMFGERTGALETHPHNIASDDDASNNVFDFDMFRPPEVSTAISSGLVRSSHAGKSCIIRKRSRETQAYPCPSIPDCTHRDAHPTTVKTPDESTDETTYPSIARARTLDRLRGGLSW